MNKRTGGMTAFGLTLLLYVPSTVGAVGQDGVQDTDRQSSPQTSPVDPGALRTGRASPGKVDGLPGQSACIVDLKPGDERLFAPSVSTPGRLTRWLDLQAASVGLQYVFVTNGLGVTTANRQQYQIALTGRVKLDAKGRFSINAGLFTGPNFIAGSNNIGLGVGAPQSTLYLKHLYLNALPVDGIEIQYGGLNIWHDESTDMTGYGYSGYVVGERVSIKRAARVILR